MSSVLETTIDRPNSLVAPPWPVKRFTVAEYHRLIDSGAFGEDERFELLEGWIVPKVTRKPPHDWTVTRCSRLISPLLSDGWIMRSQCAITTADSEPEPDHAIVRGPEDRYLRRHPDGDDVGLVVEVAEATLAVDRRKTAIYAAAGIPVYWIINLIDRQIEVHARPDASRRAYCERRVLLPGASVELVLDGRTIAGLVVDDLLPPAETDTDVHTPS